MNCKDFDLYGSAYIDDMLSNEEKQEFENHIHSCEYCSIKLQNLKTIVESVKEIEEVELPIDFSSQLRAKLEKEKSKNTLYKRRKVLTGIVAGVLIFAISIPLVNNSLIKKNGMELAKATEDQQVNEESVIFNTALKESPQDLVGRSAEADEELKIESASEPRMMAIDSAEKIDENQKETTEEAKEDRRQTAEEVKEKSNYSVILSIPIIAGVMALIYKLVKK